MSGLVSWIHKQLLKIQEQRPQIITNKESFRLIINLENFQGKYDGYKHTFQIIAVEDCILEYSLDGKKWVLEKPEKVNAGKHLCFIRAKRNKRIEQTEAIIDISKRRVELRSVSIEKRYDGEYLSDETVYVSEDGFAKNDHILLHATGKQLIPGKCENTIELCFDDDQKKCNYLIIMVPGEITVLHREKKIEVTIEIENADYLYDGREHQIRGWIDRTVHCLDNIYTITGIEYYALLRHSGEAKTVFFGTATVSDCYGNDVSSEFSLEIKPGHLHIRPRNVRIASASKCREYNGKVLKDDNVSIMGDGFVEGEEPIISITGQRKLPGVSDNVFCYTFPENVTPEDYSIELEYGLLEVKERDEKYQIDIHLKSEKIIYDGYQHSISGVVDETISVDEVTYHISGVVSEAKGIDSGIYEHCIDQRSARIIDEEGNDVSDQFEIHIIKGQLVIEKRKITIISASKKKEYDGKSLTDNEIIIEGDGIAENEVIEYTVLGEQLLPGISANTFIYEFTGKTDKNYEVSTQYGVLEVENRKIPYKVVLQGPSLTTLYDGTEKTLPEFTNIQFEINGVPFFVVGVTNVVSGIEEGSYIAFDSGMVTVFDEYHNDVTRQFEIQVVKGTLTIQHNPKFDAIPDKPDEYDIAIQKIIDQMSGKPSDTSGKGTKKYSRKQLESLYIDTIELLTGKGNIDPEYEDLLRIADGNSEFIDLRNRIVREFRDVTLLSEIEISDKDFDILKAYFRNKYIHIRRNSKSSFVDILFSVMMIQIGVRFYETSYWSQVAGIIGVKDIDQSNRTWAGGTVTKTLLAFGKPVFSENEYVANILMHSFITDPYSIRFFDYLFLYYVKDFGRDISGIQEADIEYICDSIVNPYAKRKQLISNYIAMSVRGAKEYCKDIIRKTLCMMDHSFWDEPYDENVLEGRLRERFDDWKDVSEFYQPERKKHQESEKRKRHFRSPHFHWNIERDSFEIILPPQLIHVHNDVELPNVFWFIVADDTQKLQCRLVEGYSGYKTEEICLKINAKALHKRYAFLLFSNNNLIRGFNIDKYEILFFDENGKWMKGEALEEGKTFAFGSATSELTSEALLHQSYHNGLKLYELNFHNGDFVCVKDEENYYVGKVPNTGISNDEVMANVFAIQNHRHIPICKAMPKVIIDVLDGQYGGTAILVNGSINKLSEAEFIDVRFGKTSDKKYYFIDVRSLSGIREGYNNLLIDYPGTSKKLIAEYYYAPDLQFDFPDSPYIFKEKGILRINRVVHNNIIDLCQKAYDSEIRFNIKDTLDGTFVIESQQGLSLVFMVPTLLYSWDGILWEFRKPEDIWHTELKHILYMKYPDQEVALCVIGKEETSTQVYRKHVDGIFVCDLTKLKTYFARGKIVETIQFVADVNTIPIIRVIQKSFLQSVSLKVDFIDGSIVGVFSIVGRNTYYADLYCEEVCVAEKIPIIEGKATFNVAVQTADYTVKLYEVEDDFGFDEEFELVGEKRYALFNPSDLIGGCMRINSICHDAIILTPYPEYKYYLFLERQLQQGLYEGMLVGTFYKRVQYASKAEIRMIALNNYDQVRITRLTYENKEACFLFRTDKGALLDSKNKARKPQFEVILRPFQDIWNVDIISSSAETLAAGKAWVEEVEKKRKRGFTIWKS